MKSPSLSQEAAEFIIRVFERCHKPEYIDPDPLSRVLPYPRPEDREIAALVSSSFALGRVDGILKACDRILSRFGPRLHEELLDASPRELSRRFADFRYRFFGPEEVTAFFTAVRGTIAEYGSLEAAFAAGYRDSDATVQPALETFVGVLRRRAPGSFGILLSDPGRGSAAKRLHLFLRWMVRRDGIDPGGWAAPPASKLVIPLDTHIHRAALSLGLTRRTAADLKTALEITDALRGLDPEDPVKFDFSLSRLGIHPEGKALREMCGNSFEVLS